MVVISMISAASANTAQVRERINANRFVNVGTSSSLNLRAGAGTTHQIITQIPHGTPLHILYAEGNWAYTTFNGRYGWVSRDFLSANRPSVQSAPVPQPPNPVTVHSNRQQWLRNLIGTPAKDWGNAPGTQCVDLAKWYAEQITGKSNRFVALGNGDTVARGIANFHGWNYSTDRWDIRVGDVVSFVGNSTNGFHRVYGHVVIVYEVSGNTFRYIDQWAGSVTIRGNGTATLGRGDITGRARPPA